MKVNVVTPLGFEGGLLMEDDIYFSQFSFSYICVFVLFYFQVQGHPILISTQFWFVNLHFIRVNSSISTLLIGQVFSSYILTYIYVAIILSKCQLVLCQIHNMVNVTISDFLFGYYFRVTCHAFRFDLTPLHLF